MAKALLGHVGGPDPRIVNEMRRLQRRVKREKKGFSGETPAPPSGRRSLPAPSREGKTLKLMRMGQF